MKNTGWTIVDSGPETRIAEFRVENPDDNVTTYAEAKAKALHTLKDHVAPYLARIEELENDLFAETGALPPLKAWRYDHRHNAIVTAKTKKRAMELVRETRYEFDRSWSECCGDWWYHLGQEEAVWIEERDDRKQGTGVFYRPLDREEAERILEPYLAPYRTMEIHKLIGQLGCTSTDTGVSSQGTPYKVTIEVRREAIPFAQDVVCVWGAIDDCLGWQGGHLALVKRELPELAAVGADEWCKEGF